MSLVIQLLLTGFSACPREKLWFTHRIGHKSSLVVRSFHA